MHLQIIEPTEAQQYWINATPKSRRPASPMVWTQARNTPPTTTWTNPLNSGTSRIHTTIAVEHSPQAATALLSTGTVLRLEFSNYRPNVPLMWEERQGTWHPICGQNEELSIPLQNRTYRVDPTQKSIQNATQVVRTNAANYLAGTHYQIWPTHGVWSFDLPLKTLHTRPTSANWTASHIITTPIKTLLRDRQELRELPFKEILGRTQHSPTTPQLPAISRAIWNAINDPGSALTPTTDLAHILDQYNPLIRKPTTTQQPNGHWNQALSSHILNSRYLHPNLHRFLKWLDWEQPDHSYGYSTRSPELLLSTAISAGLRPATWFIHETNTTEAEMFLCLSQPFLDDLTWQQLLETPRPKPSNYDGKTTLAIETWLPTIIKADTTLDTLVAKLNDADFLAAKPFDALLLELI